MKQLLSIFSFLMFISGCLAFEMEAMKYIPSGLGSGFRKASNSPLNMPAPAAENIANLNIPKTAPIEVQMEIPVIKTIESVEPQIGFFDKYILGSISSAYNYSWNFIANRTPTEAAVLTTVGILATLWTCNKILEYSLVRASEDSTFLDELDNQYTLKQRNNGHVLCPNFIADAKHSYRFFTGVGELLDKLNTAFTNGNIDHIKEVNTEIKRTITAIRANGIILSKIVGSPYRSPLVTTTYSWLP